MPNHENLQKILVGRGGGAADSKFRPLYKISTWTIMMCLDNDCECAPSYEALYKYSISFVTESYCYCWHSTVWPKNGTVFCHFLGHPVS